MPAPLDARAAGNERAHPHSPPLCSPLWPDHRRDLPACLLRFAAACMYARVTAMFCTPPIPCESHIIGLTLSDLFLLLLSVLHAPQQKPARLAENVEPIACRCAYLSLSAFAPPLSPRLGAFVPFSVFASLIIVCVREFPERVPSLSSSKPLPARKQCNLYAQRLPAWPSTPACNRTA